MFHAQNPNITVKVVPVPATAWSEYFQKVLTMIAGTVPFVSFVAERQTTQWVQTNVSGRAREDLSLTP